MISNHKPFKTITSLNDLENIAQELIRYAGPCKIWLFTGDLGSGKTTLIKAICKQLGVVDHVSSPTFSLINTYHIGTENVLYHIDAYRLKDGNEAQEMDWIYYFETGQYCFIEWPHKLFIDIPKPHINIQLTYNTEDTRMLYAAWIQ